MIDIFPVMLSYRSNLSGDFRYKTAEERGLAAVHLLELALTGDTSTLEPLVRNAEEIGLSDREYETRNRQRCFTVDFITRAAAKGGLSRVLDELWKLEHVGVSLPVVDDLVLESLDDLRHSWLSEADVLLCRHLLGTTVSELRGLRDLLPNANIRAVFGKPYSGHPLAAQYLRANGWPVVEQSLIRSDAGSAAFGNYAKESREVFDLTVASIFDQMDPSSRAPLLIVDDGGALIDAVARQVIKRRLARPICAVEQTTHGSFGARSAQKLVEHEGGQLLLINVASSVAKLHLETGLIAKSVLASLSDWESDIKALGGRSHTDQYIVAGYGSVGSRIVSRLPGHRSHKTVYDRIPSKTALAISAGLSVVNTLDVDALQDCTLISAAGGRVFDQRFARRLPDMCRLVSASSGDADFGALRGFDMTLIPTITDLPRTAFDDIHGTRLFRTPGGSRILVANGGYPINFDGSVDPIQPSLIQLTRALCLGGVVQLGGGKLAGRHHLAKSGTFQLDSQLESWIVRRYESSSLRS